MPRSLLFIAVFLSVAIVITSPAFGKVKIDSVSSAEALAWSRFLVPLPRSISLTAKMRSQDNRHIPFYLTDEDYINFLFEGITTDISCMMMEAEMYGMMPRAKIEKRESAPPENILNRPKIPPWF